MAIKTFKPKTPGVRHAIVVDRSHLHKGEGYKPLVVKLNSKAGRNNTGKVTMRHQGAGVKKQYRVVDYLRDKLDIPAVVERLDYDPNRSAFLALLKYADGERRYIVAPDALNVGDQLVSSKTNFVIKPGNNIPLAKIPQGTFVHSVELLPDEGAKIGRSAGTMIQVMGGDKGYVQLRMPSGEIRLVSEDCRATIGSVSNPDHKNEKLGKAGKNRRKGVRPAVRGVAMSYIHPHGAGQGKSGRHGTGGPAKDLWGNKVGKRTRKHRRSTSKFIVKRRPETNSFKKYKTII